MRMKATTQILLPVILAGLACLSMAHRAAAEEAKAFNTGASMADNLKTSAGKGVTIHLRSGETISGVVESVGSNFLHLSQLTGKEFYDALVRIDDISAVDKRVRGMRK